MFVPNAEDWTKAALTAGKVFSAPFSGSQKSVPASGGLSGVADDLGRVLEMESEGAGKRFFPFPFSSRVNFPSFFISPSQSSPVQSSFQSFATTYLHQAVALSPKGAIQGIPVFFPSRLLAEPTNKPRAKSIFGAKQAAPQESYSLSLPFSSILHHSAPASRT